MPDLPTNSQTTETLAAHAEHIRKVWTCATEHLVEHIIIIGRNLVEAREICPHGEWLPWLKREFDWSQSTADRFMQLYRQRDKLPTRGYFEFPLSAQYLLAAPSTPPEARQDIKERVESGERVSVAQVKETIAKSQQAPAPGRKPKTKPTGNNKRPVAPKDDALIAFNERVLDLVRRIGKQQPTRFAETAVTADDLTKLGNFLIELAQIKALADAHE